MSNNIFVVGPEVRGESQIGYQRYIADFSNKLLGTRNNISLTGLKRIGKTSIAKEVIRQVKDKSKNQILALFIDLAKPKNYSELLVSIVKSLKHEILKNKYQDLLYDDQYCYYMDEIATVEPDTIDYRNTIEFIFQRIKEKGYKIILAIDEFDSATTIFEDTPDYEFFRDLSSNSDIGVSLLLVSRRQLYMIEKKNFNNSTFHGIVQTYPISGFNEDDFTLFYEILINNYGITLNDDAKEKLKYYCGCSPFLVSMFAYEIVENYPKNRIVDIDEIYERKAIDVENYYKSIFANLNSDMIAVEGAFEEVSTIEKLIGIIVGPKIGVVEKDITLLKNMGYLYTEGEKYISISHHFTNALRNYPFKVDTWNAILGMEKLIKSMIRKQILLNNKEVKYISYDIWEEIFEKIGAEKILGMYDNFVEDSIKNFKKDVDILDVCSLDNAVSILEFYWRNWFDVFFNHDDWKKWEDKFRLCALARDPMAHGHEEFLSSEERSCVNSYCEVIIKILKDTDACLDIETEMKIKKNNLVAELRKSFYENNYASVDATIEGKEVVFIAAVQDSKGIMGYFKINEQLYKCTMRKQKWENKFPGVKLSDCIGNEYKVRIKTVNKPQNSVNCEFV